MSVNSNLRPLRAPDTLLDSSATAMARSIRAGEISSLDVTAAFIGRIRALNPTINAAVQVAEERALDEANRADQELALGTVRGPLQGVPFTAKDVFDTEGLVTAVGLAERAEFVPEQDAVAVARLRAAGAILIAKSNCPPGGGGGETENPVYGRTNNPYDVTRTPGGSSGGEAALLGAACSPLGLGSDSGGSIRLPAHYCGVAGLKPTAGRVPNTGAYDHPGGLSDVRTQIGPMSRFVEDLHTVLAVISGPDWQDSGVVPMPLRSPESVTITDLRLAYFEDDSMSATTLETREAVESAAKLIAEQGAAVERALPPGLEEVLPITRGYWSLGRSSGAVAETLFTRWDRFRSRMLGFMRNYDVLLCPVDGHPAPPHDEEDDGRFAYTLAHSLTGWPCVVVRAGTSPEGMTIGVQVVARPWREDVALAVARRIEMATGGWQPPELSAT